MEPLLLPQQISEKRIQELDDNLVCVFTGLSRNANDFLARHKSAIPGKREILLEMRDQPDVAQKLLESGDFEVFGKEPDRAWSLKKKVSPNVTTP